MRDKNKKGVIRVARVMLTAPDVETCYRLCVALVECARRPLLLRHLGRISCAPAPPLLSCLNRPTGENLYPGMVNHKTNVLRTGMRVEVNYHPSIQIRATDSLGRRGTVFTPVLDTAGTDLFGEGMFVIAVVASRNADTGLYTLQYEDGPYYGAFIPNLTKPRTLRLFGSVACEFLNIDRKFIQVSDNLLKI